jgi:cold shock CspA family protein
LSGLKRLEDSERVKQLLAMLSWPGPDPELTRYMEIEHPDPTAKRGKHNEYKERPVLPDPLLVAGLAAHARAPQTTQQKSVPDARPPAESAGEEKLRGTIKFFKQGLGSAYGYIIPDQPGAKDVFFTREAVAPGKRIVRDQRVLYVLDETAPPDKPQAKKIL